MFPKIPDLSYVLVNRWCKRLLIKPGQTLLLRHKTFGLIVKTVAHIDHKGLIWSRGENALSVSLEAIGPVSDKEVVGRVIYIFRRKH